MNKTVFWIYVIIFALVIGLPWARNTIVGCTVEREDAGQCERWNYSSSNSSDTYRTYSTGTRSSSGSKGK